MSTLHNLRIEKHPLGVFVLEIHRPAALNALNTETLKELKATLEEWTALATQGVIRVIVLTGGGDKAFIAGADISEMKDKSSMEATLFAQLGHDVTKLLELMPCPTIAAVHGFALGGGTEFAISCDFIIASDKAVFGQPEVGLGIIPGFGATVRLSKFVGMPRAKELIFTGARIKSEEALRIGLVNKVVPSAEFKNSFLALATTIAGNSSSAVNVSKHLMNEFSETVGRDYKLDSEAQEFGSLFGSHDQREGMTAFVEKRKAQFKSAAEPKGEKL